MSFDLFRCPYDPEVRARVWLEGQVAVRVVSALLAAGCRLDVYDGEETTVTNCTDKGEILTAMATTDEDRLIVYDKFCHHIGWVYFVYGNSGWDVVSDYTTNLQDVLAPVLDWAPEAWGVGPRPGLRHRPR